MNAPNNPRIHYKHGMGQADGGGQVSHTGSLAENVRDVESGWSVTKRVAKIGI